MARQWLIVEHEIDRRGPSRGVHVNGHRAPASGQRCVIGDRRIKI